MKFATRMFFLLCVIGILPVLAQDLFKNYRYDADLLSPDFHKGRREALRNQMPDSSMAIFFLIRKETVRTIMTFPFIRILPFITSVDLQSRIQCSYFLKLRN